MNVLICEDAPDLAFGLAMNFSYEGWRPTVVETGGEALAHLRNEPCSAVVLDLLLPDMTGFDVLRQVRAEDNPVPVLVLSARVEEVDRVACFRMGADDYVQKPFSLLELIERLKAITRRSTLHAVNDDRTVTVSEERCLVSFRGKDIHLNPREFDLLRYLMKRKGTVVSKGDILREVWGVTQDITTRCVDNTLYRLARRLQECGVPKCAIRTVPGRGVAWDL